MGGSNSGRWGGRPTIEATASYVLSAATLKRIPTGARGTVTFRWADDFEATAIFDTIDLDGAFLELRHAIRAKDEHNVSYRVYLTRSIPPYGGRRWWFVCPRYQRRAFKLYLPLGGHQFWSRQAYGLGYACQRGTALDRAHLRKGTIERALWWDGDEPVRPPRMWEKTFARKLAALEDAMGRLDRAWLPNALRLLERYSGQVRPRR